MEFVRARPEHLDRVISLAQACTAALTAQGIMQWDETYPNRAFFEEVVQDHVLFLLLDADDVAGIVVLDEWQSPQWQQIAWQQPGARALVVHAFAITPARQGSGYGHVLLGHCERFARDHGYDFIRLDSFEGNAIACRFYESHGYQYRGVVEFTSKPPGHERYRCYEKRIDQ